MVVMVIRWLVVWVKWCVCGLTHPSTSPPQNRMVKPLWTEVMELMGGEFRAMRDELYKDTDRDDRDGGEGSGSGGGGGSGSMLG